MRRPVAAVAVALVILAAATAGGLLIEACGSSGTTGTAQGATAGNGAQPPDMSAMFATALDPLVSDGTITSDQESTVIDALSGVGPGGAQGRAGQPSPGATPPSGQAPSAGETPPSGQQGSMPDPGQMFSSTLDALVSDGTITASQQNAISEALSSAMQKAGAAQQQSSASSTQG